ncbi:hypothetical protein ACS5PN_30880 [Roseateles sp. NT4]|uniref:hypothetical protein n=1 Tax=Roseateles sp. NT4 TaxID=3453715 RepID=UPI003EE8D835
MVLSHFGIEHSYGVPLVRTLAAKPASSDESDMAPVEALEDVPPRVPVDLFDIDSIQKLSLPELIAHGFLPRLVLGSVSGAALGEMHGGLLMTFWA